MDTNLPNYYDQMIQFQIISAIGSNYMVIKLVTLVSESHDIINILVTPQYTFINVFILLS